MLISIVEYAKAHGKHPSVVRYLCNKGKLETAQKIGRNWLIDDNEPYPSRAPQRLKASDVFTSEAKELPADERRTILKYEQAKEFSGLRSYPSTCKAVFDRIPEHFWDDYTAEQIGEIAEMLYIAFNDGVAQGKSNKDY